VATIAALCLAIVGLGLVRLGASGSTPAVFVAEVDDAIHPISAELMVATIDRADMAGAAAVVFVLRTPGGVLDSTRTIVSRMIAARTPVIVYIAPSGARAASAGFLITIAADVAAMAPATHIGAAHPVSAGGQDIDKTMGDKVTSDVAAFARSLAQARHRNESLVEEAVTKSRSFTEREAIAASPPIIDLVAGSLDELLAKLDGRTIRRFNGTEQTLHTAGAPRQTVAMTWRQRFLSTLAHPQIAYLLFTLGLLALTVELWNPGAVLPGFAGAVCLLMAFLAFQVLPINVAGLLLIALGVGLLVLEIKFPTFGALGVGGVVSLILGSIVLMGDTRDLRVGLWLIVPAMLAFGAIFLILGRLAVVSQRQRPVSGADAMLRAEGRALTDLAPDRPGQVSVRGEIWSALPSVPVAAGSQVHVVALRGLTLLVEPDPPAGKEGHPT
jgi:membrane-bound serine protease (ClpP class)